MIQAAKYSSVSNHLGITTVSNSLYHLAERNTTYLNYDSQYHYCHTSTNLFMHLNVHMKL